LERRSIAIVGQPFDGVVPPYQNSIGIWTHEVSRRLASHHDMTVYLQRNGTAPEPFEADGVSFRPLRLRPDHLMQRVLGRLPRTANPRRPAYVGRLHWAAYAAQAARHAGRSGVELVHIINFPQFLPIFRRWAPQARRILNMRCEWLTQLDRDLMAGYLRHADLVIGCSTHVTDLVRGRFPDLADRCVTVHNAVDAERFEPAGERPDGPPRLLFVGRVSPEKGVHVLIEAMAAVAAVRPDAHLEIVGGHGQLPRDYLVGVSDDRLVRSLDVFYEGDARDVYIGALKRRVDELGLGGHVTFTGSLPHPEVVERVRGADLLVNPSYSESFGRGPVEAMACGVPVVASRVGGMIDTVDDGATGRLVPVGDAESLADAVLELLADPERRRAMGSAARARVLESFSWDTVSGRLEGVYGDLEARRG